MNAEKPIVGTVIETDESEMIADVAIGDNEVVSVEVNRVYRMGEVIKIYDEEEIRKPFYQLEDEEGGGDE